MRSSIFLIVGIALFIVLAISSAVFLKQHYDDQKEDLLDTMPAIPPPESPDDPAPPF